MTGTATAITDLGVYDSATATFTLRRVDDTGMEWLSQVVLGKAGDLPVVGDWDANGITDLGRLGPRHGDVRDEQRPDADHHGQEEREDPPGPLRERAIALQVPLAVRVVRTDGVRHAPVEQRVEHRGQGTA